MKIISKKFCRIQFSKDQQLQTSYSYITNNYLEV